MPTIPSQPNQTTAPISASNLPPSRQPARGQQVPPRLVPTVPATARRSGDLNDPDPFAKIEGMAPNAGQDVLPHVVTFQGLLRNVSRTYYVSDEAIKHSWDNARFMRNDPGIMECLEQRQRSTALLGWHLEAEDENDPIQSMLVDELTAILKKTPNFLKYRECLLHALWYGKYGVAHRYRWAKVNGRDRIVIQRWRPVNGDKIVFRYDDGTGEFDEDQVGIRVGPGIMAGNSMGLGKRWIVERFGKVAATDHGLAYFLEHWERPLLAIHKHMIEDAEYEAPDRAGAIHGVGIRNRLYWLWFQKQETIAWLMEYLERSAFGIEIWSYPSGNKEAFEQTKKAAQERIGLGRNIVLVPRHPDSDVLSSDLKRIEPGMAGADILDRIIREYFGWQIKRYILGQILTSETASTGLGSGVATIHLDTYLQIIKYDAINLAETITTDTIAPLIDYNWPQFSGLPIKFVIETESPDIEGKLAAWERAYNMGLRLKAADVAELIGAQVAQGDEEALVDPQHAQAAQQQAQQRQAMGVGFRPQILGPDGQPLRPTTPEQDAQELGQILAGQERYGKLRPGMERIIYHRDGTTTIERYKAVHEHKASNTGGDKPGPEWRTIGGGSRVLIGDDGTIMAGCPGLETEDVDEIGEGEDPENRRERDHRKEVAKERGLKGDDLTPVETKRLEQEPATAPATATTGRVRFGQQEYEVKKEGRSWFYRLNKEAGWTMASQETAAEIDRQLGAVTQKQVPPQPQQSQQAQQQAAIANTEDDIPFDIPPSTPSAPEPQSHQQTLLNPRTRVGKAIIATAADYEIPPDDLADAVEYLWEQRSGADDQERQRALEQAHKLTGLYQSDVKWLKNNGFDHTSAKRAPARYAGKLAHFDAFAQELARDFPVLGLGNPDDSNNDFAAALWDILDSDRVKSIGMDDPAILRQAAEVVLANQRYDAANVMAGSYEEFQKRGEVQKYRKWKAGRDSVERYARKAAKGQGTFQWKEDEHPRDADGQFVERDGERAKPAKPTKPETKLPERTADTMSDAIAMSSPNGRQSKRSQEAAQKRLGKALFGEGGLQKPKGPERDEVADMRKRAKELREFADRGLRPRAHRKEADRLEAEADRLEKESQGGGNGDKATKEHKAGDILHIPAAGSFSEMFLEVFAPDESGKIGIGWIGDKKPAVRVSPDTVKHIHNDLRGLVDVPANSGNPLIDKVSSGQAKFLGKGDDGMAFDTGDQIVKVSTPVPFQPLNPFYRTPAEAQDRLVQQVRTSENLRSIGVPGIPETQVTKHGDKAFAIRQKLDIPSSFTQDQLDQIRESIKKMHEAGYSLNDQLQVGVGPDKKAYHYDLGKVDKLPESGGIRSDRVRDDITRVADLFNANGAEFFPWGETARTTVENFADTMEFYGDKKMATKDRVIDDARSAALGLAKDNPTEGKKAIATVNATLKKWGIEPITTTQSPNSLFPDDKDVEESVRKRKSAEDFKATQWKGDPSDKGKQGTMFDRLNWKKDQQGLFDESVSNTVPERYEKPKDDQEDHPKTVAIDLDGTLATYEGWQGEDHFGRLRPKAKETLQQLRDKGYRIIIWTTRGDKEKISAWLDSHELPYDHINENPDQPDGSSEKVIADLYIDDRAIDGSRSWLAIQEDLDRMKYEKPTEDRLPGGRADRIPDYVFDPAKLAEGIKHEMEHTDDPDLAKEIAKDHLFEDSDYYEKLAFMESADEVPVDSGDNDDEETADDQGDPDESDTLAARVTKAARKTARNPSEAEREAGNYRKGKCRLHGMEIAIETPQGATRSGRNKATGKEWSIKMPYHYGYIKRTESEADGDHIDVFLGPDLGSEIVFVIDQRRPGDGGFDEHKCMLGWTSADAAKKAYHEAYQDGWQGFDGITAMTMPQFREWIEKGDTEHRVAGQSPSKYAKAWQESDHPRGQPENKGEFVEKGKQALPSVLSEDQESGGLPLYRGIRESGDNASRGSGYTFWTPEYDYAVGYSEDGENVATAYLIDERGILDMTAMIDEDGYIHGSTINEAVPGLADALGIDDETVIEPERIWDYSGEDLSEAAGLLRQAGYDGFRWLENNRNEAYLLLHNSQ